MTISKSPWQWRVAPNLVDYEAARASFDWEAVRAEIGGFADGGLNLAEVCLDRHAAGVGAARVALRWRGRHGEARDLTFAELREDASRFANVLASLGVQRGERVFVLTGRIPALYGAVLGTLAHGGVVCTLFAAFGPEPIRQRAERGDAKVLVTTSVLYRRKVAPIRAELPNLEHVLLVDGEAGQLPEGTRALAPLLAAAAPDHETVHTRPDEPALLHFTSGTTGVPKGAVHVHEAVLAHAVTGRLALDLHPDDVFWCTADPGWVTGTSYGIVSPLANGVTSLVDEGEFDARRWCDLLEREQVSVWYTAPTAVRMLMRAGVAPGPGRLPALRFIASVGEALNPEAVRWGEAVFGLPIHDNWWQTETGGIMVANFAACEIRPGSMGRPVPGIEAAVARRDERGSVIVRDGQPDLADEPLVEGELVLRRGWPSMFRGYLHDEERYAACFVGDWYLTGDLVTRDADGYFWFVGRGGDVIKSAGHLVGPFEVESALMEHPAVAEAAVIGIPDEVVGERVKAFVVLVPGREPSEALRLELVGFGRTRLGAAIAPKEVAFVDDLPRTRSGKVLRRLLRARDLGLPEGDLSTLETSA